MAINTLQGYFASKGQALPSLAERGKTFSSLGLGTGYAGTADQNNALLAKLMGGGSTTPAAPTASPSGQASGFAGSGGAFSNGNGIVNVDQAYQPLTDQTAQVAKDRQALIDSLTQKQNDLTSSFEDPGTEYKRLYGEFGLPDLETTVNTFKNQIRDTSNRQANLPNVLAAKAAGTFATNGQVTNDEGVQGKLLNADLIQLGNNLDPILTAYNTGVSNVNNIVQNTQAQNQTKADLFKDLAARTLSGFDTSSEQQLNALSAKIQSGIQLSTTEKQMAQDLLLKEQEYKTTLAAAGISAGATLGAAGIGAEASKQNAALNNPGITITKNPNGTYSGALPSYLGNLGGTSTSVPAGQSSAVKSAVASIFGGR